MALVALTAFSGCVGLGEESEQFDQVNVDAAELIPTPDAILLIHGVEPNTNTATAGGHDCNKVWDETRYGLAEWGYRNKPIISVGYYTANRWCNTQLDRLTGSTTAHFGPGTNEFTTNTDLRHIGYRLAWYIWNNYTLKGKTVGIVGHSMGGLIARYAIGMTGKSADFPPRHRVTNFVMVNTPNNGAASAWLGQWANCNLHCQQMSSDSVDFIQKLNNTIDFGNSGVPTRLKIGSNFDFVVSGADSATYGGEGLQVVYSFPKYGHGGVHQDRDGFDDAQLSYRHNSNQNWTYTKTGDHGVRLIQRYVTGLL